MIFCKSLLNVVRIITYYIPHLIFIPDFVEMFIHHITTILLMGLSWTCNLIRVGTLVLVIHDCADILLEVSKIILYYILNESFHPLITEVTIKFLLCFRPQNCANIRTIKEPATFCLHHLP